MLKTKLFTLHDEPQEPSGKCKIPLDKRINDLIKSNEISWTDLVDIKFSTSYTNSAGAEDVIGESALLIYKA